MRPEKEKRREKEGRVQTMNTTTVFDENSRVLRSSPSKKTKPEAPPYRSLMSSTS